MSLESKIEELTIAITELTKVINSDIQQDFANEVSKQVEQLKSEDVEQVEEAEQVEETKPDWVDEPGVPENKPMSFDDFKNTCLKFARDKSVGKTKVREVLTSFGAVKAAEVKEEDRIAVVEQLEAL